MPVTCAFAAGILLDRAFDAPVGFVIALWAAAAVASAVLLFTGRKPALSSAAIYALVLATGMLSHGAGRGPARSDDVSRLVRERPLLVSLRGQVIREPWYSTFGGDEKTYHISYDIDVTQIRTKDGWTDASGTVRATQYGSALEIPFGARMEVTGRLSLPRPPTVPGQFDYTAHLTGSGVRALLSVPGDFHARVTGHGIANPLRLVAHHVRWHARRTIERNFRRSEGAILEAVILGNRRAVGDEVLEAFATSGTMHFLAISGLHVGIIAGLIWWVMRLFGVPPKWTRIVVMGTVILYAYVTGGRPPIVRAAVMTCAFCFATIVEREADLMNILAAAALALLVSNPVNLFDAGFQLSFAAVFAIAGLMPLLTPYAMKLAGLAEGRERIRKAVKWLALGFAVSVAAWLGAAPLVAKHFHLVTPAVVLVSPLLLPVVAFVLAGGIVSVALAAVSPTLAQPAVALTSGLVTCLKKLVLASASFRFSYWHVPDAVIAPAYYIVLAAVIVLALRPRWKLAAVGVLIAWNISSIFFWDIFPSRQPDTVTMLDVGKGNCVVVTTESRHTLVYDVGSTSVRHVGSTRLAPYLWHRRIRRIDTLALSHPEADHINGVREIAWRFPIGNVLVSDRFRDYEQGRKLVAFLERRGIPVATVAAPALLKENGRTTKILWPRAEPKTLTVNDSSLVAALGRKGKRILLTGDVEDTAVWSLLGAPGTLACDVLQVPHHGRPIGPAQRLAEAARPAVALISDDARELSSEAAALYERVGSRVYATWDSGTITIDLADMSVDESPKR